MNRRNLHFLIDGLLLLGAVGLVLTGLLLEFVLPSGSRSASVWGMTRHEWGGLHFWIAMGMIGCVLLHVALNWGWVCSVAAKLLRAGSTRATLKRKLVTGVGVICAVCLLTGGFLYAADQSKVEDTGGRGQGHETQQLERDLEALFLEP